MKNNPGSKHIQAVVVNHNTSRYTELMLRSLFAMHSEALDIGVTVFDNASDDEMTGLHAYAQQVNVPIFPSGFGLKTENNSHGHVLKNFVLAHPDCAYYLFLDTDVYFFQPGTVDTLVTDLEADPLAYAAAPRLTSNVEQEIDEKYWDLIYHSRLHPCCALVKNTPTFRRVLELVGLGCYHNLLPGRKEYLDTFQLMTAVMATHGYSYLRSHKMVQHFFCVSYDWDPPEAIKYKLDLRDKLLAGYQITDPP